MHQGMSEACSRAGCLLYLLRLVYQLDLLPAAYWQRCVARLASCTETHLGQGRLCKNRNNVQALYSTLHVKSTTVAVAGPHLLDRADAGALGQRQHTPADQQLGVNCSTMLYKDRKRLKQGRASSTEPTRVRLGSASTSQPTSSSGSFSGCSAARLRTSSVMLHRVAPPARKLSRVQVLTLQQDKVCSLPQLVGGPPP